jgi:hypothetical protein
VREHSRREQLHAPHDLINLNVMRVTGGGMNKRAKVEGVPDEG